MKKKQIILIIIPIIIIIAIFAIIIILKNTSKVKHIKSTPEQDDSIVTFKREENNKIITETYNKETGETTRIEEDKKIDEKKKDLIKKGDKIYQKSKRLDNFINTNKTAIGTIKSLVYEGEIPQNDEEANNESLLNVIIIENDNTKAILRIKDEVWEFKRVDVK